MLTTTKYTIATRQTNRRRLNTGVQAKYREGGTNSIAGCDHVECEVVIGIVELPQKCYRFSRED